MWILFYQPNKLFKEKTMDINFSKEDLLFREEVREFYDIEKLWSSSIKLNSSKI